MYLNPLEQCANSSVTIDLTGDDEDGDKVDGGIDEGDVAPVTAKAAKRHIIDLTDDD
jgi:hypothetical protein